MSEWGVGIEDVKVVVPQSVYDYLKEQEHPITQAPSTQQEVKPDLYFPKRAEVYPSSQITEKDTPQIKVFLGVRYKSVESAQVKVELPQINWHSTLAFSFLEPGKTYSSTITLPELSLPQGAASMGYRINLTIDPVSQIKESTKANNSDFVYIEVLSLRYQLEAQKLSITPVSDQYTEGSSVTLKGTIANYSNTDLNNVEVQFLYNAKDQNTADLREITTKTVSLKKGEIKIVSCPWTVKKSESYYTDIYFIADPHNRIKEQNESEHMHTARRGIRVKKKETTEKPAGGNLKQGIDLAVSNSGVSLSGSNLIGSDYLGVWVKNLGTQNASVYLQFTGYWIETSANGRKTIKTAILGNESGRIEGGQAKLFKFYYKSTKHKSFIFSKHVKIIIQARNQQDIDTSNNTAVFKIGDFDGVAKRIKESKKQEQKSSTRPDLAIIDIKNITPPLKKGKLRTFKIIIENTSTTDIKEAYIDCVIRPKGAGRPHPEIGGKTYRRHIAPINKYTQTAIYIDYTPIHKGEYEIVASVYSIKWNKLWEQDANQSNNSLLKYFGVEVQPSTVQPAPASSSKHLDLFVEDIWIDNKTPNVGEVISGGFRVRNDSKTTVKNIEWAVYSNNDTVAQGTIPQIKTNSEVTVTVSSRADKKGTFIIKAVVDPQNKIKETNKHNNYKEIKIGIEEKSLLSLPQVDLAVTSLKLGKSTLNLGQFTQATAQIRNFGKDTAYAVAVNFEVNNKSFFITVIDKLQPGQSKTISAPIIGFLPGVYSVRVSVDKKNLIKELNEHNNQRTAILTVKSSSKLPSPLTPNLPKDLKNIFHILK